MKLSIKLNHLLMPFMAELSPDFRVLEGTSVHVKNPVVVFAQLHKNGALASLSHMDFDELLDYVEYTSVYFEDKPMLDAYELVKNILVVETLENNFTINDLLDFNSLFESWFRMQSIIERII